MGEARELEAGHVLLLSPKKGQDLEASGSTGGGFKVFCMCAHTHTHTHTMRSSVSELKQGLDAKS